MLFRSSILTITATTPLDTMFVEISATSSRAGGGRYAVSGSRLTLGSEQHWIYEVPTGNAEVVELLIVDGVVLTRED